MLFNLIESGGNWLLRLDPDAVRRLQELKGSVICIQLEVINRRLYLLPKDDGIAIRRSYQEPPHVTLSGSPLAFALLGIRGVQGKLFRDGKLTIEGDVELGQRFQNILSQIDLDWEEFLARFFGDIPAHQIGNLFRALRDWQQNTRNIAMQNASEYLQEEARILAPGTLVSQFTTAVDELRSAVDRLEQRVQRLQSLMP